MKPQSAAPLFRAEALAHHAAGRVHGSLLRLPRLWLWWFWVLLAAVTLLATLWSTLATVPVSIAGRGAAWRTVTGRTVLLAWSDDRRGAVSEAGSASEPDAARAAIVTEIGGQRRELAARRWNPTATELAQLRASWGCRVEDLGGGWWLAETTAGEPAGDGCIPLRVGLGELPIWRALRGEGPR